MNTGSHLCSQYHFSGFVCLKLISKPNLHTILKHTNWSAGPDSTAIGSLSLTALSYIFCDETASYFSRLFEKLGTVVSPSLTTQDTFKHLVMPQPNWGRWGPLAFRDPSFCFIFTTWQDPARNFALPALLVQTLTLISALYTLQIAQHFQETKIESPFLGNQYPTLPLIWQYPARKYPIRPCFLQQPL